jgi:streptogramin lyase
MVRQGIFSVLLAMAQTASSGGQIPISRLKPDAAIPVVLAPGAVASDDAVWIQDGKGGAVIRIDAKDNKAGAPVSIGASPCGSLVAAFSSVWAPSCGDRVVSRVSTADRKVTAKADIGVADPSGRIAAGIGSLWVVTDRKGIVTRIDPDTNQAVAEINIAGGAAAVLFHDNALWVTSGSGKKLTRVNPHNNEIVEAIDVGPNARQLASADGAVWTLNQGDGSVTRVDPATNKPVTTIAIGMEIAAGEIATGEGSVWISAPGVPLVRIDPRTNKVAQRFSGEGGGAVLLAHGSLWLARGAETWRLDPKLVAAMRP